MSEGAAEVTEEIVRSPLKFVHLRIHTDFSLDDGLQHVEDYCKRSARENWPALAITDHMNLFGMVRLYRTNTRKGGGLVKPIAAVDVVIRDKDPELGADIMSLYALNERGYHNICEIISRGHRRGPLPFRGHEEPAIDLEWFAEPNSKGDCLLADDIIVLSGGRNGPLGKRLLRGRTAEAEEILEFCTRYFPDRFYLELVRTGREHEEECNRLSVALAEQRGLPVVATNEVVFMERQDFYVHEVRVASQMKFTMSDPARPKIYSQEQYLKSQEEMCALFADIPEALENSVEIARRCSVTIPLFTPMLPRFPVPQSFDPDGPTRQRVLDVWDEFARKKAEKKGVEPVCFNKMTPSQLAPYEDKLRLCCYLIWQSETGLERRLAALYPDTKIRDQKRPEYEKRLYMELAVIIGMDFPGYFLIVMEFIQWAKANEIPIGPGRGSGAGSLVAYAIRITDLDPLRFDLLFERFLNPERVSMPDFDIDICMDRRGEVIQHVSDLYGHEAVSQIVTFGSMAAKNAIKDVARALNMSYTFGDSLARLIPSAPGANPSIEDAFDPEKNTRHPEDAVELKRRYDTEPEVREVIDIAKKLEGVIKSTGKHAGGVVISPSTIVDFSPVILDKDGNPVAQYDKHDIEDAGLIKFDFLGLKTITVLKWAVDMVNSRLKRQKKPLLDISAIPLDDPASYEMLCTCETTGVFQLESRGMRELIGKLRPTVFDEIIALVALYRPGPLDSGMVDNYVNRKHGREPVSYPMPEYQDECLKPILESTYGVVVYQEQVMQLAQALAGYTLGGADLLRRAMGKKIKSEMVRHRQIFTDGAAKLNHDPVIAGKIFDIVEKFAEYGFNKSHSAAYALVAYQTLWMKVHYPAEFLAAMMTGDKDSKDKIVTYIAELRRLGIKIYPPDVNRCQILFTAGDDGSVIYGLCGVSGLGIYAMEEIVSCRKEKPYEDLFDFCCRVDLKKFSTGMLETLIWVGAFDSISPHRNAALAALPTAMKYAQGRKKSRDTGQFDMFSSGTEDEDPYRPAYGDVAVLPDIAWLTQEKKYLGLYLTGHPMNAYRREILHYGCTPVQDLVPGERGGETQVIVAGYAHEVRWISTKKGGRMATVMLDDGTGDVNVLFFSRVAEENADLIRQDTVMIIRGTVKIDYRALGENEDVDPPPIVFHGDQILPIDQLRNENAAFILIRIREEQCGEQFVNSLAALLERHRGEGQMPVKICYMAGDCWAAMDTDPGYRVRPTNELLTDLQTLVGTDQVAVEF